MRQAFLLLALILGMDLQAQFDGELILLRTDSAQVSSSFMLGTRIEGQYFSNAVSSAFISKLIGGGFIDENLKSSVYDKLEESNQVYARMAADVFFYNMGDTLFKKREWGLSLAVGARMDAQAIFSDDLFRLGFSGNRRFRGQVADLSESSGNYMLYQKIGIGLFHKKTFSGINLSFVNGQELYHTSIDRGGLFTSENGDSLALEYDGEAWYSDRSKRGLGAGNGAGAAIDLNWNLKMSDGKGILMIALRDLGFIQWSSGTTKLEADSSYSFTGLELEDVLNGENTLNFNSLDDSLAVREMGKAYTSWLPANMNLSLIRELSPRFYYKVSLRSRFLEVLFPEIRVGGLYRSGDKLLAGVSLSYNVYGNLAAGASVEWMPTAGWNLQLNAMDVAGLVDLNRRGGSAALGIAKFF